MKSFAKNSQTMFKYLLLTIAVWLSACRKENTRQIRRDLEASINHDINQQFMKGVYFRHESHFMLINKIFTDTTPSEEDLIRFKRLAYIDSLMGRYAIADSNQVIMTAMRQYVTDYMFRLDKECLGLYDQSQKLYGLVHEYQSKDSDTLMDYNNPAYYQKNAILRILFNQILDREAQIWYERYAKKDPWILDDPKIKLPSNVRL